MSKLAGKHVADSLGGAAGTIAVPDAMRLRGWGDVMGGGAVAIDGDIAIKQECGRGEVFMLTGLGGTRLKAVKQLMGTGKGRTTRRRRQQSHRRSLGDDEFDCMDDKESIISALMTSTRINSWVTRTFCWVTS